MANKVRLVGEDGKLVLATFGADLVGTGTSTLDTLIGGGGTTGAWFRITAKGGASAFPAGLAVGDLFYDDGSLMPATGDKCRILIETDLADISGWRVNAQKDEFDMTTLNDTTKVYRYGKTDLSGSLTGVRQIGVNDGPGGLINAFWRIIRKEGAAYTVSEIHNNPIYLKGVTQKDVASGETEEFYFMQVALGSFESGAEDGSRQEFTTNFRIAAGGDVKPTLYQRLVA